MQSNDPSLQNRRFVGGDAGRIEEEDDLEGEDYGEDDLFDQGGESKR